MSRATDLFSELAAGGSDRIMRMIADSEAEELFLDFKRSADSAAGTRLHDRDRSNLGKAISGFGNSEGGVIVWGVDCRTDPQRGDVPSGSSPITNPSRFKSWLDQAVSGLTIPPHDGVQHASLTMDSTTGFVATLIPRGSHPPYQTVQDSRYLMRAGSSFVPVPHGVLAGMFGRTPQPEIHVHYIVPQPRTAPQQEIRFSVAVGVRNVGLGVASDTYFNANLLSRGGPHCGIQFQQRNDAWDHTQTLGILWNSMMKYERRLAPDSTSTPVSMTFALKPPFDRDLLLELSAGATGSKPYRVKLETSKDRLVELYQDVFRSTDDGAQIEALKALVECVLTGSEQTEIAFTAG